MKILIRTACGCSRITEDQATVPAKTISIPISKKVNLFRGDKFPTWPPPIVRIFEIVRYEGDFAEYKEVVE